jgi:hypothetical protein
MVAGQVVPKLAARVVADLVDAAPFEAGRLGDYGRRDIGRKRVADGLAVFVLGVRPGSPGRADTGERCGMSVDGT